MPTKRCTKCKLEKDISEFYLNCYGRNGACKPCVAEKNRAYYAAKKEKISEQHAARKAAGAVVDVGAVQRRQRTAFSDRYSARREKVNNTKASRYASDPKFHATVNMDTALRRALASGGPLLERAVGCDETFFREWIEYQFTDGMTHENYGTAWSYDHVVPRSAFDLRDPKQVQKCNNWSNLRPITGQSNSVKHNTRDNVLEQQQEMLACLFEIVQEM